MVKASKDYTPPDCFKRFEDMTPGTQFRDFRSIEAPGEDKTNHYVKVDFAKNAAVRLSDGKLFNFDNDEYFYPVNEGWIAEFSCYGYEFTEDLKKKSICDIVSYIMQRTESRRMNSIWQNEVAKYFPSVGVMSFSGPKHYIKYIMDRVEIKSS